MKYYFNRQTKKRSHLLVPALFAEPEQLMAVVGNCKSKLPGYLFLDFFHLRPSDFSDYSAPQTNQVVMVGTVHLDLKPRFPLGISDFLNQLALFK